MVDEKCYQGNKHTVSRRSAIDANALEFIVCTCTYDIRSHVDIIFELYNSVVQFKRKYELISVWRIESFLFYYSDGSDSMAIRGYEPLIEILLSKNHISK